MRLVIQFESSDGCTFSCTEIVPVLYESPEAFLVDFEVAAGQARDQGVYQFVFANQTWYTDNFFYLARSFEGVLVDTFYPPEIRTVDEWFAGVE